MEITKVQNNKKKTQLLFHLLLFLFPHLTISNLELFPKYPFKTTFSTFKMPTISPSLQFEIFQIPCPSLHWTASTVTLCSPHKLKCRYFCYFPIPGVSYDIHDRDNEYGRKQVFKISISIRMHTWMLALKTRQKEREGGWMDGQTDRQIDQNKRTGRNSYPNIIASQGCRHIKDRAAVVYSPRKTSLPVTSRYTHGVRLVFARGGHCSHL